MELHVAPKRRNSMASVGGSRVVQFSRNGFAIAPPKLNARKGGQPNRIRTTRFTPLTWMPKSLYWQFHRAANIYFLFVSIIVCFPWSPIMWQSVVGSFCGVLVWTALKDLYEDFRRRRDDDAENLRKTMRWDFTAKKFLEVKWMDVQIGDILLNLQDEALPSDVLILHCPGGQAFISTVNLDGETNLKERHAPDLLSAITVKAQDARPSVINQASMLDSILAEAAKVTELVVEQGLESKLDEPRVGLTDMDGSLHFNTASQVVNKTLQDLKVEQPSLLNFEHFVPRGCVLRNTSHIISMSAYTGSETKTRLNIAKTEAKVSNMQVYLNRCVQGLVTLLALFCLYCASRAAAEKVDSTNWLEKYLFYWIILYQVVPISLYVCFEIIKLILGFQINFDKQMIDLRTNKGALARTADLVEEMGQVNFVFSDKTGTLTENEMVFARCCIGGQDLGDFRASSVKEDQIPAGIVEAKRVMANPKDPLHAEVRWFFFCLVTCHGAQVDMDDHNNPHFSGSSPDEVAFLDAGHSVGITFLNRKRLPGSQGSELHVTGPAQEGGHDFNVLCEIPFNSDRKRMTVICQYKGEYFCICKGADNVMQPLCDEPFDAAVAEKLSDYSKLGLRTLAIASKIVERTFLEGWMKRWAAAQGKAEAREEALAQVAAEVEHSFMLSGISAIEDRLQDGVPEAIVTIKEAGIRFWVLTGDKTETAVEIVRACRLFTERMPLAYMVGCKDEDHAVELLEAAKKTLSGSNGDGGLILDGTFVKYAIASETCRVLLYQMAVASRACVCCRLSPQQKRKLVELVREQNRRGITLAIGDGANDVSMIQGAHVGIGIRGKEGNQAVQASDVAISQFRFLVPLLLCHGRRAYRRVATFLCYFIYKHVTLAFGDVIWAHQFRFRGKIAYPEWLSSAFPAVLTALPVIVTLCFDVDVPDEVANTNPDLYSEGLHRTRFNGKVFAFWILSAMAHGSLSWCVPSYLVGSTDHTSEDFWRASCCSFVLVIICVNSRLLMVSLNPFSKPVIAIILLSYVALIVVLFVLGESSLGYIMQPTIKGVPHKIFSDWNYLRTMVLTPLALFSDLLLFQGMAFFFPTPLDTVRRRLRRGELLSGVRKDLAEVK